MKKKTLLLSMALVMLWQSVTAQTTNLKSLTVILNYKDNLYGISETSVNNMMNQTNFNEWGMIGSIKDYYYAQTNGKFTITSEVISVNMPNNLSDYYTGGSIGGPTFIMDVAAQINLKYPAGFTGLTSDPANENRLRGFNLLSNTLGGASYAFGNVEGGISILNNGQPLLIGTGNISMKNQTDIPPISTITHEMGHSYFGWADYYATAFCNLGDYDVMGSAGTEKAAMPVNPGLRLKQGWITNVVNITGTTTQTYTLTSNNYSQIHKYTNPSNPKEYLLFHALKHGGFYQPIVNFKTMDQGLAIWYVNEDGGGFDLPGVWNAPFIRLVQADKKDEMHDEFIPNSSDVRGDLDDLYDNVSNSFPNNHPLRWKDGGELGISITAISAPGNTMTFKVNAKPNRVLATSDRNGTIVPKGVINVTAGQSKTFTFTPNLGYEIDVVMVGGIPVTTSNTYTIANISSTKTINVTFKKKTSIDPLPSPWVQADIGTGPAGLSAYAASKFNIESLGSDISGGSDNFRFVFQTLNGDGSIVAKIDQSNKANWSSKVGLMIRESLQPGSAQSMIAKIPLSGVFSQQRNSTNAGMIANSNPSLNGALHIYNLHNWLKITRTGNEITMFCSRDKTNWVEISRETLSLGTSVYIGMCVTGAFGNYASKAVFDSVSVTTTNASPVVTITSPLNNSTFSAPATITINAIATDANGTITKVDFYNGTTLIGTDNTSPYSFTWTNVIGTNVIYAKATDNQGAITTSLPVAISTPCTFTDTKIIGDVIGTLGSWANGGSTREKAFDGDITTYFDGPEDISWTGLSLTSNFRVTGINFYPREAFAGRMVGGKFQGSNTADFSSGVIDLATIIAEPTYSWNCLTVSTSASFQFIRYISPASGVGNVAEIEFYGTTVTTNPPPTVSITSPTNNASFTAPANITINATAADANGTVSSVAFYNGTTLLGTDATSPYSFTWSSAAAGTYSLTARATDNQAAVTTSTVVSVTVNPVVATDDVVGPACGANNTSLTYELNATKRANATSYSWWYTASSQSITPVSGNNHQAILATGVSFASGQVCVGVNYNAAPWYASYCKSIAKCAGSRIGMLDGIEELLESEVSPNPSLETFNINLAADASVITIVNETGKTVYQKFGITSGNIISLGENFDSGLYFITIHYLNGTKEVKKIIKTK